MFFCPTGRHAIKVGFGFDFYHDASHSHCPFNDQFLAHLTLVTDS